MNYLQRKKLAFMSIVNQIKGFVRTVVGIPPLALPDCVGGTNLINYTISGNSVQDGTPSPENPIEIQSVGDLTTKNLLPNDWEIGFISITSGANQSSSTYVRTKDYFTLDISKNYYISSNSINTNTTISWYFYDENKNFISRSVSYKNRTIGTSDCNVTVPTNAVFFRLAVLTTDTTIKVQIELGSTATEYEPYGYKIPITVSGDNGTTETAIYLDEPLRKVGDVADYIDFENGKVVRNIGAKKVNFSFYNFDANNYLYLRVRVSDMLKDSLNCISDKIKQFATFPGSANNNQLMISGKFFYYLVKAEENQQQHYIDLMAGTEIHYILETSTEEIIQLPYIPSFKGTTILSVDTTIQPSNMSATYYSTSKE